MLKGVNKTVVEINNTDDDYIEKAILFINPEKQNSHSAIINHKARKYLNSLYLPKFASKKPVRILSKFFTFLFNIAIGALIMYIFLKIL